MPQARTVDLTILHAAEMIPCQGSPEGVRGSDLNRFVAISDGALAVDDGKIVAVGNTTTITARFHGRRVIDAAGCLVSPGLVDPHTHLMFAGSRHDEWEDKVLGRSVSAGLGGGIMRTVGKTRAADDETLVNKALRDLDLMAAHGTTTVEAKTGYGLSRQDELRLLRLISGLKHAVEVVPTFLGAHVVPSEYAHRRADYVDLVKEMLPDVRTQASYCDMCCDPSCFTPEECLKIGTAGRDLGMGIRVHADQTGECGGAQTAARLGAASADHLDYTTDQGFAAMAEAGTVATLLPGVTHHLMEMTPKVTELNLVGAEKPFMPLVARRAIDAGGIVALATNYNPGTSLTLSMQEIMRLAARLFRLSYAEIWHLCTINAAKALDRGLDRGSLEVGKRADIVIWSVPEHGMVINRFGVNLVDTVIIQGRVAVEGKA
ncbi:MAG: imidazolonepropionase [Thermodesulfobacteriota bacterium]